MSKLIVEKKILPLLVNFCNNYSLKLCVLARRDSKLEKEFYFQINNKITFLKKKSYSYSYRMVDSSVLVISLNNTLGYESISRNNKTVFYNLNDRQIKCDSYKKFAWPKKYSLKGPFWTNKLDKKNSYYMLEKILKMRNKNWKNLLKKYYAINYQSNLPLINTINKFVN